ncbi:heparinase II/III family protein [Chitinophaga sp.]|uniref:heparinase II/III domain-containing protein n=1 Tax=Chitinophaga sp. TaxID=1869181 RepID=UPI0031DF8290
MKTIFITLTLLVQLSFHVLAQDHKNLLTSRYTPQQVDAMLIKDQSWVSLPAYSDRNFWNNLPPAIRTELIQRGEEALKFNWDVVKATDFMAFTRTGNRDVMQNPNGARKKALQNLALAELAEGKGRFTDQLINGIWAISEQSSWALSAHLPVTKNADLLPDITRPVIDLGSADAGALLSWVHYYFRPLLDKVNPLVSARIRHEVREKILEPYYTRNDFWWMGFSDRPMNNWNPWVNYNVMQCILLLEDDAARRSKYIYKAITSIDKFTNSYHADGACDEGPSYWSHAGGKYFECLELLQHATGGKLNVFSHPLIKNMGNYISNVYINAPYYVNFADASAKGGVNEGMVYRYGKAIGDDVMMGFGSWYAHQDSMDTHPPSGTIEAVIADLMNLKEIMAYTPREPLINSHWYPQTEVAIAREYPGSQRGFYFAAKGGHNAESHNHNDVGTFILYYDGKPCLVDAGVGTYTRQTFSPDRYKIWTMQSSYHNLPEINGTAQHAGRNYKATAAAFSATPKAVTFSADIASAYPEAAKVKSWKRGYRMNRGGSFVITDNYTLEALQTPPVLHLLTACKATVTRPGQIKLEGDGFTLTLHYDAKKLEAGVEHIDNNDPRLERSWPGGLNRIALKGLGNEVKGELKVEVKKG